MVDKVKALELRESGLTYQQIADELKCSLDWCKRNLKGHCKHTIERPTVQRLISSAKLKSGITSGDIKAQARALYPDDFVKGSGKKDEQAKHIKRIKAKVKKDKQALVRPYWLVPEDAKDIFHSMLRKLQQRDEQLQEDVDEIRQEFNLDSSYSDSLMYAMVTMSAKGSIIMKRSVVKEIDRLGEIVEELELRNNDKAKGKQVATVKVKDHLNFSDIEEYIY